MDIGKINLRMVGLGRILYGVSVAGLAALGLAYGNFEPIMPSFPASLPGREVWAYGSEALLLAAGAGLLFARSAPAGALIAGLFEAVWVVARARPVLLKPMSVGSWYGLGEALGPLLGAWILYAILRSKSGASVATALTGDRALRVARVLFGGACVAYGAAHFAYATYTAAMVPVWLPGRTGIAYLTGAFHAAAGLGLILGVVPRLAATLEAAMLSVFGLLVWLPSFLAHPLPEWASPRQVQWSETLLTFLLAASAWIVAASLGGTPCGAPTARDDSPPPAR